MTYACQRSRGSPMSAIRSITAGPAVVWYEGKVAIRGSCAPSLGLITLPCTLHLVALAAADRREHIAHAGQFLRQDNGFPWIGVHESVGQRQLKLRQLTRPTCTVQFGRIGCPLCTFAVNVH